MTITPTLTSLPKKNSPPKKQQKTERKKTKAKKVNKKLPAVPGDKSKLAFKNNTKIANIV